MKRGLVLIAAVLLVAALVPLLFAQGTPPQQAPTPPPPTFTLTDLGPVQNAAPGGVTAVNASGEATGIKLDSTNSYQRAFLYQNGTVTDLGSFSGGNISFGYGINDSGVVAGVAQLSAASAGNTLRAAVWQNGVITSLDPSAANSGFYSGAFGINSGGDVAGYINNGADLPVIWKGGTASGQVMLSTLPCPFTCQGRALAINDAGKSAGISVGNDRVNHPVMWDGSGNVTDLGTFGSQTYNQANAINKSGLVVGYSQLPLSSGITIVHAFLYQNGTLQDIGVVPGLNPGGTTDNDSSAWGINSNGDIVGISAPGASPVIGPAGGTGGRAFLYIAGNMYDLTGLVPGGTGWQLENAYAISDQRQIVGVGIAPDHTEHGYLLTPIAPKYTLTDLGPMQITAAPSGATALNASGQVTGFYYDSTFGANRAFLWNNGTLTEFGTLGGAASFGYGINGAGQVVGTSDLSSSGGNMERAFLWQNGVMGNLGDPNPDPSNYSVAFGINSAGDVAGYEVGADSYIRPLIWKGGTPAGAMLLTPLACPYSVCQGEALAVNDLGQSAGWGVISGGTYHPVIWDNTGQPTDLGTLGPASYYNQANAINKSGVAVGHSQFTTTTVHAFVWRNGTLQDLGTIPGTDPLLSGNISDTNSSAWGINSKGDIVGISAATQNAVVLGNGGRAFLNINGVMYDLSSLLVPGTNWQLEAAWAINDNGQIVGVGKNPAQAEHGYLLTPVGTATTTALASSVNPSVFGQQVSITATVNPNSPSSNTPSGTITFSDGVNALQTVALTSGTAIFNTAALAVGSHSITATYSGDSNFNSSTSGALSQTVNQGATIITVAASANPGFTGQPVTFTAVDTPVAPAAGTATGTVTFFDGSTSLGTGTLSAGQATLTTSSLAPGSHSVTVTYAGDSNFLGIASSAVSVAIQQTTTTTLIVVPNPVNAGQPVTLTATVAGSSGAPTGETVTFLDGATVLGTGTISAGGTATFTTASLAAGNHSLSASYPGDTSFAPSTSSPVPLSVVLPPVVITDNEAITVTDTSSFPDVADAEAIKVTDTVTVYAYFPIAISPAPPILSAVLNQPYSGVTFSGTGGYQGVTLTESGAVPGMSFAIAGASATFSGTPTQAGTFPFTITGTDSIGNKLNQNYSLMVSASCPAISVSPSGSLGIVTAGNPFSQTFTASGGVGTTTWSTTSTSRLGINFVGGVLSGIPTQSGTFAVTITATDQNGCQGSSNVSLVVLPPPAVITDNETITVTDTASFPDVFDSESVKVTDQVFVQVISPTTTSISAPGVVYGTPAVVTVSVGSPYGTVSGNVTLSVDGGAPTTIALSSGSAVFNAGILPPGTHSLAASFPAQSSFLASSTTGAVFVSQAPAFTSANATTFTVGAAGTFSVTTTGIPYPSLTIPSGTLPTGVTFTDNLNGTGTLAGIPAPGTGAIYPFTITANNGVLAPALQSFTLTVDQAPAITNGSGATFTEGVPGSFTLTSTGFPIPALTEGPTLPSGLNFIDNGDGTATLSGTPAAGTHGSYAITFAAANGIGSNATQSFTLTINLGLAITSGSGTTFTEQMPGSFLVTTLGFPVASLTETGPLPSGVTFTDNHDGTASLAGTPAVGTSNLYPITITANNGAGASTTQAFTLTVNSTAAITSGSTTTFTVGSAGFFSITTMGTPAPSLTFTGTLPTGASFVDNGNGTATLSGTPTASTANNYPLAITANNGVGTAAVQNFTLVVNQGAAILSGNSTTFTVGVAGTFTVMTSGSPTPALTETPPLVPTGVTFVDNGNGTATLSGTPAAGTGGTYPITITANNGVDLPAVQTFTLNINQNPAITSANMATFNELVMGSFTVTSAGNPLPTLTEVGNLPNGVTFTNNGDGTAFLGGVPAAGSAGQYGFTITAANGVLPSATQTFTLTVTPDLSFISSNSTSFITGVLSQFTIRTAGTPLPTLTYSGALPAGVTFTAGANGTATLGGTAQAATEGTYPITFTAVNGTGASATQPFILTIQPPGESAPVITSANHATFVLGLLAGDGVSNPYNFFRVTTTGFPVPALTVTGLPASSFRDNHDGTATIAFTPTATGTQRFRITATGPLGLTAAQNFTLTTVGLGAAPMFTSANQVGFMTGVPNSFTVAAGPYVDQIVVTAGSTLPAGLILTDNHNGTATLSGTLVGAGQTWSLQFTASNPSLNPAVRTTPYTATQTFSLAVLPRGDTAPVITSANHATFAMGLLAGDGVSNPYNFFKVTTTGLPVPKLTAKYIVNGVAGGTVPYFHDNGDGTATIAFAPPGAGTQTFTITATGPLGLTDTQIFTLQIVSLGTAPKFTSVKQVGFTAGVRNSFTVAAGPFVDQIAVAAGALPSGLTFIDNHDGTATLSGTVPITGSFVGNDSITLTAKNPNVNTAVRAAYTATQAFTISVLPPGYFAPVITSPDHATFYYGLGAGSPNDPINYFKVTTTGFPVPKLTARYILNGGGTLLGFVDNGDGTASIAFKPGALGTARFWIIATGPLGLTATQAFTLNVVGVPPVKFTSANQVGFTAGVPNSFTVAAGPFVYQIAVTAGVLPAGVTLTDHHDGTATLSGIPLVGGQTWPLQFTASTGSGVGTFRPHTATQTFTLAVLP